MGNVHGVDTRSDSSARISAVRRSILVVDDEADIRDTLVDILTGARHRVVTADFGREALRYMAAERFDVNLTDVRMPDIEPAGDGESAPNR